MTRAVWLLLPLLLVLTACGDDTPKDPPPTTWLQFADQNVGWLALIIVFALMCWNGGRGKE